MEPRGRGIAPSQRARWNTCSTEQRRESPPSSEVSPRRVLLHGFSTGPGKGKPQAGAVLCLRRVFKTRDGQTPPGLSLPAAPLPPLPAGAREGPLAGSANAAGATPAAGSPRTGHRGLRRRRDASRSWAGYPAAPRSAAPRRLPGQARPGPGPAPPPPPSPAATPFTSRRARPGGAPLSAPRSPAAPRGGHPRAAPAPPAAALAAPRPNAYPARAAAAPRPLAAGTCSPRAGTEPPSRAGCRRPRRRSQAAATPRMQATRRGGSVPGREPRRERGSRGAAPGRQQL